MVNILPAAMDSGAGSARQARKARCVRLSPTSFNPSRSSRLPRVALSRCLLRIR